MNGRLPGTDDLGSQSSNAGNDGWSEKISERRIIRLCIKLRGVGHARDPDKVGRFKSQLGVSGLWVDVLDAGGLSRFELLVGVSTEAGLGDVEIDEMIDELLADFFIG